MIHNTVGLMCSIPLAPGADHGCLLLPTHNLQRCKGLGRLSGSIGLQLCASLPGIFLPLCSIAVMISFVVVPETQAQVGMIGCARGQRYPFTTPSTSSSPKERLKADRTPILH